MKKQLIIFIVSLFLISLVSALSIFPNPNEADAYIDYVFNFSRDSGCTDIVLSNSSTIHTNARGFGFIDIDISSLNSSIPEYLCEYKDGSLRKTHNFSDIIFNSIRVNNLIANNATITNLTVDNITSLTWENVTITQSQISDFDNSTNESNFWNNLDIPNATQFDSGGDSKTLNLKESWFTTLWNVIFGTKTTDDLTEGTTNLYDNQSWNESRGNELYTNQTYVDDLIDTIWDVTFNNTLTNFLTTWLSGKTTDDLSEGTTNLYDNVSWNQSYVDTNYVPYTGATDNLDLGIYNITVNYTCFNSICDKYMYDNGSTLIIKVN